ncbi:hypothetical protein FOMPIDRAFT_1055599 [Fomitopsis schrenkii]|uniref:Uncharacterized protein n=1 Tax=Fomitopsis schrenkii TaxID=2126942 RepID=S8F4H7_FOMSC|nr:hypothetical protein FOMPIDRAFT_1055599 [Fomitopsis schrenkii]
MPYLFITSTRAESTFHGKQRMSSQLEENYAFPMVAQPHLNTWRSTLTMPRRPHAVSHPVGNSAPQVGPHNAEDLKFEVRRQPPGDGPVTGPSIWTKRPHEDATLTGALDTTPVPRPSKRARRSYRPTTAIGVSKLTLAASPTHPRRYGLTSGRPTRALDSLSRGPIPTNFGANGMVASTTLIPNQCVTTGTALRVTTPTSLHPPSPYSPPLHFNPIPDLFVPGFIPAPNFVADTDLVQSSGCCPLLHPLDMPVFPQPPSPSEVASPQQCGEPSVHEELTAEEEDVDNTNTPDTDAANERDEETLDEPVRLFRVYA